MLSLSIASRCKLRGRGRGRGVVARTPKLGSAVCFLWGGLWASLCLVSCGSPVQQQVWGAQGHHVHGAVGPRGQHHSVRPLHGSRPLGVLVRSFFLVFYQSSCAAAFASVGILDSQTLILPYSHPLTLSPSHPLALSPSRPLTLSPSHPLTRSPFHPLTSSLCFRAASKCARFGFSYSFSANKQKTAPEPNR